MSGVRDEVLLMVDAGRSTLSTPAPKDPNWSTPVVTLVTRRRFSSFGKLLSLAITCKGKTRFDQMFMSKDLKGSGTALSFRLSAHLFTTEQYGEQGRNVIARANCVRKLALGHSAI